MRLQSNLKKMSLLSATLFAITLFAQGSDTTPDEELPFYTFESPNCDDNKALCLADSVTNYLECMIDTSVPIETCQSMWQFHSDECEVNYLECLHTSFSVCNRKCVVYENGIDPLDNQVIVEVDAGSGFCHECGDACFLEAVTPDDGVASIEGVLKCEHDVEIELPWEDF